MAKRETFGEYLRACRLKAGFGLRVFAEAVDMQPSNLSNVEHGRIPPPQDLGILGRIAETLGFPEGSKERDRLFDLAVAHKKQTLPPDVAAFAARTPGIPVMLRTLQNRRLTKEEIAELTRFINRKRRKR
ncbi:MAG: helix-turn-helix domain-containing protein [candidate division NC10 bacterium]|nr:helix-turn-helix domain-containing protein [candidate division NC10 bacterium]